MAICWIHERCFLDDDSQLRACILRSLLDIWTARGFDSILVSPLPRPRLGVYGVSLSMYSGAHTYIDQGTGWAIQTGLEVFWIDLQGAWESQNGFDNSGHNGKVRQGKPSQTPYLAVVQLIANK